MSKEHKTLDDLFKSLQEDFKDLTSGQIEDKFGQAADASEAKQYVVDAEAKAAMQFFVNGAFQTIVKPITSASTFKGLVEKINTAEDITLTGAMLMYIAELYSQLTYKTNEEAIEFCDKHAAFTDLYTEQYEDQMRLKFISQIAKEKASAERMAALPQEEIVVNETAENAS